MGVRLGERNFLEYAADAVMVSSFFLKSTYVHEKRIWGIGVRICAYAPTRIVIFILLITYITTRFFEKNFLREKMIFLRKNYFRKGLS